MQQSKSSSRRGFLKASAALGAGAALASNLGVARSAHAAGSDTFRAVLIGCGGRGTGAAANALNAAENVKLVAAADAFPEQVETAISQLVKRYGDRIDVPVERRFAGLDAYKDAIAVDCDMVVIATPPGFRPPQYRAAIEAGKHVFMEKPLFTDAPGFNSVMETNKLADEKGLKVGVGLQRHHEPYYQETIQRIHEGAIGALSFLRVYWNMGNIWAKARKEGDTEMMYQVRNWQYFYYFGGDHIVEQHVHNLDVANWVMQGHPIEANGMGGRQRRDEFPDMGHIYDHHFVEFTYPNGVKLYSQCRQMPGCWDEVGEYAYGTKGMAVCASEITGENAWKYPGKAKINSKDKEHVDLHRAIVEGAAYNEGWHGATSTMTAVLGRMATYSGQKVTWEDAIAKGPSILPEILSFDANPPILPGPDGTYKHAVAMPGIFQPFEKLG
ncbi:MAG: Gfo/Idh/MocA family protein [Planctomycetota bacterium]